MMTVPACVKVRLALGYTDNMRLNLADLLSDADLLHRLVREIASVVESRDGEIERLQLIIKKLQRTQFRRRSKRLD